MATMAAMAKTVDGALLAIVIVPSPTDLTILSNALTPTGYALKEFSGSKTTKPNK